MAAKPTQVLGAPLRTLRPLLLAALLFLSTLVALVDEVEAQSRPPAIYNFHIMHDNGTMLTEFDKTMYALETYHLIVEAKDENGWLDIDYIKIDMNPWITDDIVIFYYQQNDSVSSISSHLNAIGQATVSGLNGTGFSNESTEFRVSIPISLKHGITNLQGVMTPDVYAKDLDPENGESRLSSSRYKQLWHYSSDQYDPIAVISVSEHPLYPYSLRNHGSKTSGGTSWPVYLAKLSSSGDVKVRFDACSSFDPDSNQTNSEIEKYVWKVYQDYAWNNPSNDYEGHTFERTAAMGCDWTYTFYNQTADPSGFADNPIRIELTVEDSEGRSSAKAKVYIVVTTDELLRPISGISYCQATLRKDAWFDVSWIYDNASLLDPESDVIAISLDSTLVELESLNRTVTTFRGEHGQLYSILIQVRNLEYNLSALNVCSLQLIADGEVDPAPTGVGFTSTSANESGIEVRWVVGEQGDTHRWKMCVMQQGEVYNYSGICVDTDDALSRSASILFDEHKSDSLILENESISIQVTLFSVDMLGNELLVASHSFGDEFVNDSTDPSTQDTDEDGAMDDVDAFPSNPNEWSDFDGDGVGDNSDVFPTDENEYADYDGDGVGDNSDAFPWDAAETVDSDGDGVGDNSDAAPDDPNIQQFEATEDDRQLDPVLVLAAAVAFLGLAILGFAIVTLRRRTPPPQSGIDNFVGDGWD
jgi:hypothetical protein